MNWLNYGETLLTNVVAGIFTTGVIILANEVRYYFKLHRKFDGVKFEIYYKGCNDFCRTATCKVRRNIICYEGTQVVEGSMQGPFEGQFIMNPLNLRAGEGIHFHSSFDGFNFPRVIIKDKNVLYVETFFPRKEGTANTDKDFKVYQQAYVWKRATV
jgi:hypothetical protein